MVTPPIFGWRRSTMGRTADGRVADSWVAAPSLMTISDSGRRDPRKARSYARAEFRKELADSACQVVVSIGVRRLWRGVLRNLFRWRLASLYCEG